MVYPMMVTLNVRKVLEGGDARAQLLTQAINFAVVPFVTYGLGLLFFRDQPYMALGLLLAGLVPPRHDHLLDRVRQGEPGGGRQDDRRRPDPRLHRHPLLRPAPHGAEIEVDTATVLRQIAVIVFVPMIAGYLTRQGLIRRYGQKGFQQEWAPRFPAMSTVGVLGIVFVAIALKSAAIVSSPGLLVKILVPLLILYPFNYALSTFAGKMLLPRGDAIALVYGSVMRNLSIALAIAINAFGAEGSSAALVIAVSYIVQVQSAAWYVKLTDRVFGPPAPAPAAAPAVAAPVAPPAAAAEKPVPPPAEAPAVPVFRKILYATDLSETARHAIRYACGIGVRHQADITCCTGPRRAEAVFRRGRLRPFRPGGR
jgi:ACR3 family arsenite efflux pump ArsB